MMRDFDLLNLPLDRNALIEASAGTGKTFTIVNLMLRYLLEPFAGQEPLTIGRILVVTFTRAAVDELRGRMRKRIEEAVKALQAADGMASCKDDTLREVLKPHCASETGRLRASARLQAALLTIDEASVSTIHSFCQRALVDFAFESGQYFEHRIISDQSDIVLDAVQQFWRETFYNAPDFVAGLAARRWKTPQGLLKKIYIALRPNIVIAPSLDQAGFIAACEAARSAFQSLSRQWLQHRDAIDALLASNTVLSKTSYKPAKFADWLTSLDDYFSQPAALLVLPKCYVYFTPDKLSGATKKGGETPTHPFFDACADWQALVDGFEAQVLAYAAARVSALIDATKQAQRFVYFDDLLTLLDATLQREQSAALIAKLREQYPVALIDEFQDTDAIQYRIFSTLYSSPGTAMLLIGDPKQAIYKFRGADINTYVAARAAIADDARYTLGRNFRSSEAVVGGVNRLFTIQQDAFANGGEIDFQPVTFNTDNAPLLQGDELGHAGFELQWIESGAGKDGQAAPRRKADAMQLSARHNAMRIHRLLTTLHRIRDKPVCGNDIAVLVRDRVEAQAIRDALRNVGVDSVFLSKERVFETAEAVTMYRVLCACARPRRAALIRAVLGSELIALTAQRLTTLDEFEWAQHADRFHQFHRVWTDDGFYAMWRQLLREYPVAANLLAQPDGERRLTNFQQLADLVASFEHSRQIDITLRWFAREMQVGSGEAEDQVLRLESEANLVQVVTIHRSKGLEYPIVFLPFLFRSSERKESASVSFDADSGQVVADFGSSQYELRAQRTAGEQQAEDIRLLYVALTRAKYHLVITTGNVEGLQRTALHSVVFGPRNDAIADLEEWKKRLREIITADVTVITTLCDTGIDEFAEAFSSTLQEVAARQLTHAVPVQHRMHSYSSLIRMATVEDAAHDYDAVATLDPVYDMRSPAERVQAAADIFEFPRGANAGTFWHEMLEKWRDYPFNDKPAHEKRQQWIGDTLQRYGFEPARWQNTVDLALQQILLANLLPNSATTLASLPASDVLAEMEFFLPLSTQHTAELWRHVAKDRHQRGHIAAPVPSMQAIEGMLKGFIDAIVAIDGKYYVVDYKTNHLGGAEADYTRAAMEHEILHHDYDLQYLIYCVALHRMLGRRLSAYDYARHFGGVLYLFVRGMGHGGDFGVFRHLPSLDVIEGMNRVFTSAEMIA